MKLNEIHIRDPFILVEDNKYYMYGTRGENAWGDCTGLDVYVSSDLENWSDPIEVFSKPEGFWATKHYWAPEVHAYRGAFYMLVSFKSDDRCHGTQILRADTPTGPFLPHSDGPVTPPDWESLDGTLYIENGKPYMVFCHEWLQVKDGEMCAMELSEDLTHAVGKPVLLFHASDPEWSDKTQETFITDGPFLYRTKNGKLLMIWSTSVHGKYCEAVYYSESGSVLGPWVQEKRRLYEEDGGHGMIFKALDGALKMVLHYPNITPNERPKLFDLVEQDEMLYDKTSV